MALTNALNNDTITSLMPTGLGQSNELNDNECVMSSRNDPDVATKVSQYDKYCTNIDHVELAKLVTSSGRHNSHPQGLCIPINNTWNVKLLKEKLINYHDRQIIDHLEFGWPANRNITAPDPIAAQINHRGTTFFEQDIDKYLTKEIKAGRIAGPYHQIPSNKRVGISPLNSRAKKDSEEQRIIIDFAGL